MRGWFDIPEIEGMTVTAGSGVLGFPPRKRSFEKAAERIEGVMPGIALVFHEGVEHRDAGGKAILRPILDRSCERGAVRETLLCEEGIDLDLRMDAGLDVAVDFQDESVSENDGAIALLRFQDGGAEVRMTLAPGLAKGAIVRAHQFPGAPAKTPSSGDRAEKCVTEGSVVHRTVHHTPAAILSLQLRHGHIRELRFYPLGFLADRDGSRHD